MFPVPNEKGSNKKHSEAHINNTIVSFFSERNLSLAYPKKGCVNIAMTDIAVIAPVAALSDHP